MPSYKLTYVNARGNAEIVRLVFAAAGMEYEDVRLEEAQWPELKPKTPMGQIPILEVDGTMLCQSNSMARYVAKLAGLAGKTPLEQARVDMVMDAMVDMLMKYLYQVYYEKDVSRKVEQKKDYVEQYMPPFLTNMNKLASDSGHFVGDELTLADISFYNLTTWVEGSLKQSLSVDEFHNLKKVMDNVTSNPGIGKWLKERPETPE